MLLVQAVPNRIETQLLFVMKIKINLKLYFHLEKHWLESILIDHKWILFNFHKLHKKFNVSLYYLPKHIVQLFKNHLVPVCK